MSKSKQDIIDTIKAGQSAGDYSMRLDPERTADLWFRLCEVRTEPFETFIRVLTRMRERQ